MKEKLIRILNWPYNPNYYHSLVPWYSIIWRLTLMIPYHLGRVISATSLGLSLGKEAATDFWNKTSIRMK